MTRVKIYLDNGTSLDFDFGKGEDLQTMATKCSNYDFIVIAGKAIVPTKKIAYMTTIIEKETKQE